MPSEQQLSEFLITLPFPLYDWIPNMMSIQEIGTEIYFQYKVGFISTRVIYLMIKAFPPK